MKRALVLLVLLLLTTGCGGKERAGEAPQAPLAAGFVTAAPTDTPAPTAEPTPAPTAAPTPTPTATPVPTPTPLFLLKEEGSNDLVINQDLYDSFTEMEFPLPTAPVVLIYHTHAEEAYRQTRGYAYAETGEGTYKTLDKKKSVVALGELLKRELEQRGFTVIHDDTDVEPPEIKSAYSRSLEVMERYPEAVVYIDLHRNTANVKAKKDDVVTVDGQRCARMFFVVGTGIGTYEGEYDTQHDWQRNYALAKALTERLKAVDPKFALDIRLKVGRYNQHVSPYCLLVEVGHNANTFDDAKNSIPYLADALAATLILPKD